MNKPRSTLRRKIVCPRCGKYIHGRKNHSDVCKGIRKPGRRFV